ncbi:MAG: hypothetical protein VX699_00995, partial [Myxococcota bacterium]|nr:hypothetical protein [Myxococcota bacterium]
MQGGAVLSQEQIDFFVEHGYLKLEQCIPRSVAQQMVRETFQQGGCLQSIYSRTVQGQIPYEDHHFDLEDSTKWSAKRRLDVDTGHFKSIEELSPKLWAALADLAGGASRIKTTQMASKWILNTRYEEDASPSLTPDNYPQIRSAYWHADTISKTSTLIGRFDGFSLLFLWSDLEAGGGGTLYSPQSIQALLKRYNQHPEGLDTTTHEGLSNVMESCDSFLEVTGNAGDVIILHALGLHAFNERKNKKRVRILENLGVALKKQLNYSPENHSASPLEKCVSSKIQSFPRVLKHVNHHHRRLKAVNNAIDHLITNHPDYFRVSRNKWYETTPSAEREKVYRVDYQLMLQWATTIASQLQAESTVSYIKSAAQLVRSSILNQRDLSIKFDNSQETVDSGERDFSVTGFSRLLRGVSNCEGVNHLLYLVLRERFPKTVLWDLFDVKTNRGVHVVVKVVTPDGWAIADAWADTGIYYVPKLHTGAPLGGIPSITSLFPKNRPENVQFYPVETFINGNEVILTFPSNALDKATVYEEEYFKHNAVEFNLTQLTPKEKRHQDSKWQQYLRIRAEHSFHCEDAPKSLYKDLLDSGDWTGSLKVLLRHFAGVPESAKSLRGGAHNKAPLSETISSAQQALANLLEDNAASSISDKLPAKFLKSLNNRLDLFEQWGHTII